MYDKIELILLLLLLLGPVALLARLYFSGSVEQGVVLWGLYGLIWGVMVCVSSFVPDVLSMGVFMVFVALSLVVILLALITLLKELASQRRNRISIYGAFISLYCGCLVIAGIVFNPLVI